MNHIYTQTPRIVEAAMHGRTTHLFQHTYRLQSAEHTNMNRYFCSYLLMSVLMEETSIACCHFLLLCLFLSPQQVDCECNISIKHTLIVCKRVCVQIHEFLRISVVCSSVLPYLYVHCEIPKALSELLFSLKKTNSYFRLCWRDPTQ